MRESVRAEIRQVADGLVFPEGPVWHPDGYLLFSDVHGATIERLKPDGGTATWWSVGKKTNGLILSPDRRKIIACCYSERELLEIDAETREYRVITRECDGRPYVNVNDVAADSNGFIYFSDPKWNPAPDDVQGVYCVRPDGTVFLAAHLDQQPNGLVVSPDERYLYVARSGADHIVRFQRRSDGTLTDMVIFVELERGAEPDGMTVDSSGNLYIAEAGTGRLTVVAESGQILGQVQVCERMATNCEFHGQDSDLLYVTGGGKQGTRQGRVWELRLIWG
ncbi:MAG: hypothetical protein D6691_01710 [Candidatus Hydrogenedentota bacterium]|uniref:Gluconolactonase n=1 Tax=Sumerlaea chitinivorans TaxID=2250252 RepID=A0A2Z4Y3E7_SUMC1|nr:Gluconolactonase [Candidatus Sumerlaea chitinivorans]RMH30179.1 MAG: hypothetical protein D6691_01710 [Candidatus Hydrogenedentota bacterium]GIX44528.1 MAG: hypothetical protein KatS3mg130_0936 [Candidatus Sumerlaea sp.]